MTHPTHGLDPNALEALRNELEGEYGEKVIGKQTLYWLVTAYLAALSQNPGTSNTSGEALRAHLREHWLASIVCDHEAKTDTAVCSCSQWADTPHPSVGAAVDAWIEHVFETLPAALEPRASDRGAEALRDILADMGVTAADPMWADHVELPKAVLRQWIVVVRAAIRKLSE